MDEVIQDRLTYNAALARVKVTMTVIGHDASTNDVWAKARLRAASQNERQALRIKDRDCCGDQVWAGDVQAGTIVFVLTAFGELREQLSLEAFNDPDALGEVLDDAFGTGNV